MRPLGERSVLLLIEQTRVLIRECILVSFMSLMRSYCFLGP